MHKKRKIILKIWIIFIAIIILILLFFLGLRLPKLPKSKQQYKNTVETQSQYQIQYIHDTNKIQNIIKSLIKLKQLKESKQTKEQTQEQEQEQKQEHFQFEPKLDTTLLNNYNINEKNANRILALGLIGLALPPLGVVATATSVIAFLPLLV